MTRKRIFGYGHTVLSFFVPHDSKSGMLLFISSHIEKRTWSQLLSLVPRCKAFALPIKSKRATRISPTKGLYTMMLADDWVQLWLYIINEAYICIHLTRGISRCFVLDLMIRVCEVLHRQNQSVQKMRAWYVCNQIYVFRSRKLHLQDIVVEEGV